MNIIKMESYINPNKTNANPFKIISVDPNRINNALNNSGIWGWGKVEDGEWYKDVHDFRDRQYCRALENLINNGDRSTILNQLEKNDSRHSESRYGGTSTFDRIREIERLADKLEKGYKSQAELLRKNPEKHREAANDKVPAILNEILVDIGPDGELIYRYCGQNRLRIAQLLDLESVYVIPVRRHSDWEEKRRQLAQGDLSKTFDDNIQELASHPDMNDIRSC